VVEKNSKGRFHLNGGIEMHFPFESPYKVQFDMMNAVVDCVQNGVNGLIESPTGTGKDPEHPMLCHRHHEAHEDAACLEARIIRRGG
jgi:hypothetical protein